MIQNYIKGKTEQSIIDNIYNNTITVKVIDRLKQHCSSSTIKIILSNTEVLSKLKKTIIEMNPYHRFFYGCKYGFADIVEDVLEKKKDNPLSHDNTLIDLPNRYATAFSKAVKNGHIDVVKLFLNRKTTFDLNNTIGFSIASEFGYIDIVKLMLEHNLRPNRFHNLAIKKAAEKNHLDIVELLLKQDEVRTTLSTDEYIKYKNLIK